MAEGEPSSVASNYENSSPNVTQAHGLEANGLTLSRILSSLGFQQRSGIYALYLEQSWH